jgi:CheY-like chemotaxis protein
MLRDQLRLLLADDDADDCIFFKEALEELQVSASLTTVKDGMQLMEYLARSENPLPHALYLDLNMPRKNGIDCLSEIKSSDRLKHLPVIIYSTSFNQQVADLLYERGANYYIQKPAEFSAIKNVLLKSIELITSNDNAQPVKKNFLLSDSKANKQ